MFLTIATDTLAGITESRYLVARCNGCGTVWETGTMAGAEHYADTLEITCCPAGVTHYGIAGASA